MIFFELITAFCTVFWWGAGASSLWYDEQIKKQADLPTFTLAGCENPKCGHTGFAHDAEPRGADIWLGYSRCKVCPCKAFKLTGHAHKWETDFDCGFVGRKCFKCEKCGTTMEIKKR